MLLSLFRTHANGARRLWQRVTTSYLANPAARSLGSKTPGDPGTSKASTTNDCWPSRGPTLKPGSRRPNGRIPKNTAFLRSKNPTPPPSPFPRQPPNCTCTCGISAIFCTVCTVSTPSLLHTEESQHSDDELNLRHFHVHVRVGLLELHLYDHRDVTTRRYLRFSAQLALCAPCV